MTDPISEEHEHGQTFCDIEGKHQWIEVDGLPQCMRCGTRVVHDEPSPAVAPKDCTFGHTIERLEKYTTCVLCGEEVVIEELPEPFSVEEISIDQCGLEGHWWRNKDDGTLFCKRCGAVMIDGQVITHDEMYQHVINPPDVEDWGYTPEQANQVINAMSKTLEQMSECMTVFNTAVQVLYGRLADVMEKLEPEEGDDAGGG